MIVFPFEQVHPQSWNSFCVWKACSSQHHVETGESHMKLHAQNWTQHRQIVFHSFSIMSCELGKYIRPRSSSQNYVKTAGCLQLTLRLLKWLVFGAWSCRFFLRFLECIWLVISFAMRPDTASICCCQDTPKLPSSRRPKAKLLGRFVILAPGVSMDSQWTLFCWQLSKRWMHIVMVREMIVGLKMSRYVIVAYFFALRHMETIHCCHSETGSRWMEMPADDHWALPPSIGPQRVLVYICFPLRMCFPATAARTFTQICTAIATPIAFFAFTGGSSLECISCHSCYSCRDTTGFRGRDSSHCRARKSPRVHCSQSAYRQIDR